MIQDGLLFKSRALTNNPVHRAELLSNLFAIIGLIVLLTVGAGGLFVIL